MRCWLLPRGKTLRTKVRDEKALTKAKLQAVKEWEERKSNFLHLAKKQLAEWSKQVDPIEVVAVGGLTIIVYRVLDGAPEVTARLGELLLIPAALGMFWAFIPAFFWKVIPEIRGPEDLKTPESLKWLISFVVAFIIVRHPEVMTTMFQGATSLSQFALGLLK